MPTLIKDISFFLVWKYLLQLLLNNKQKNSNLMFRTTGYYEKLIRSNAQTVKLQ